MLSTDTHKPEVRSVRGEVTRLGEDEVMVGRNGEKCNRGGPTNPCGARHHNSSWAPVRDGLRRTRGCIDAHRGSNHERGSVAQMEYPIPIFHRTFPLCHYRQLSCAYQI